MVQENGRADRYTAPMLGAMLQELLLACCRVCAILQDVPEQIHTTDREIVRAARFITEHYAEPITAADIAAAAGFSPNYLSHHRHRPAQRLFQQQLLQGRLQKAVRLHPAGLPPQNTLKGCIDFSVFLQINALKTVEDAENLLYTCPVTTDAAERSKRSLWNCKRS